MITDLFASTSEDPSDEQNIFEEEPDDRAKRRIRNVLTAGHPVACAFSSGKDSSVLASLLLSTARQLIADGLPCPPIYVLHGDTLVEQPEIVDLAANEIRKMRMYAETHNIPLQAVVSKPTLTDSFAVRVIGGRALPAFPDTRADCSVDWKVKPNEKALTALTARLVTSGQKEPVVMTGVRHQESLARDQRIEKRGEKAETIWKNEMGALRLSPILDFTTDDVWTHIGLCNAGAIASYSDFAETMRIYRDSGGSSCVIVADMKGASNNKPCGTRTGCWMCTRVGEDKSMRNMIQSDPKRYSHLQPLSDLRDFVSRTQYDWSLRNYVGRSIDADGYITIAADTYSPEMLESLLRYTLSAQNMSGVPILSIEQVFAIDARWSQYALFPPFSALKIFLDVSAGNIIPVPQVQRYPKTPVPRIGKIRIGNSSFNKAMHGNVSGLRHVAAELHGESCGFELKALRDGSLVLDVEDGNEFSIDADGAADFLQFEADRHIKEYCHEKCSDWTWGFKTYLQYGTMNLAKGRSSQTHEILQRSQWRQQNNLHGQRSCDELADRCDILFEQQLSLI